MAAHSMSVTPSHLRTVFVDDDGIERYQTNGAFPKYVALKKEHVLPSSAPPPLAPKRKRGARLTRAVPLPPPRPQSLPRTTPEVQPAALAEPSIMPTRLPATPFTVRTPALEQAEAVPELQPLSERDPAFHELPPACVLYPTDEEFRNPMRYLNSEAVVSAGHRYGIVKIVPPRGSWPAPPKPRPAGAQSGVAPPKHAFLSHINAAKFRFNTRTQPISQLQRPDTRSAVLQRLLTVYYKLHDIDYRTPLLAKPIAATNFLGDTLRVDMYRLLCVIKCRPLDMRLTAIEETTFWEHVKNLCGHPFELHSTKGAKGLRQAYELWLRPVLVSNGFDALEDALTELTERRSVSGMVPKRAYGAVARRLNPPYVGPPPMPAAPGEGCDSLPIPESWHALRPEPAWRSAPQQCAAAAALRAEQRDIERLRADLGVPGRERLPDADLLRNQLEVTAGYGDGGCLSLDQFQWLAEAFRRQFCMYRLGVPEEDIERVATTEMLERAYWDVVDRCEDDVAVLYGHNLSVRRDERLRSHERGATQTTLFDMQPRSQQGSSGFNLNRLPNEPGSLLALLTEPLLGINVPMLYIGMLFSTFAWHTEDQYLNSINYLHGGADKVWYGVPGSHVGAMERALRDIFPTRFKVEPRLLYELVLQCNPRLLARAGVPVYRLRQQPGEFVLTFPSSYHAGLNVGFNVAEAVNFANTGWLRFGALAEATYHLAGGCVYRPSVFSYPALLWLASAIVTDHGRSHPLAPNERAQREMLAAATDMANEEIVLRQQFARACGVDIAEPRGGGHKALADAKRELALANTVCCLCQRFCYLSAVTCRKCRLWACIRHSLAMCPCMPSRAGKFLAVQVSEHLLRERVGKLAELAGQPEVLLVPKRRLSQSADAATTLEAFMHRQYPRQPEREQATEAKALSSSSSVVCNRPLAHLNGRPCAFRRAGATPSELALHDYEFHSDERLCSKCLYCATMVAGRDALGVHMLEHFRNLTTVPEACAEKRKPLRVSYGNAVMVIDDDDEKEVEGSAVLNMAAVEEKEKRFAITMAEKKKDEEEKEGSVVEVAEEKEEDEKEEESSAASEDSSDLELADSEVEEEEKEEERKRREVEQEKENAVEEISPVVVKRSAVNKMPSKVPLAELPTSFSPRRPPAPPPARRKSPPDDAASGSDGEYVLPDSAAVNEGHSSGSDPAELQQPSARKRSAASTSAPAAARKPKVVAQPPNWPPLATLECVKSHVGLHNVVLPHRAWVYDDRIEVQLPAQKPAVLPFAHLREVSHQQLPNQSLELGLFLDDEFEMPGGNATVDGGEAPHATIIVAPTSVEAYIMFRSTHVQFSELCEMFEINKRFRALDESSARRPSS